jgi:hypothetical protein
MLSCSRFNTSKRCSGDNPARRRADCWSSAVVIVSLPCLTLLLKFFDAQRRPRPSMLAGRGDG